MNKVKIILGYICNFILAVLIFLLVSILIIKNNIFNKEKVKNTLENNNYYEKVSNTILEDMQNYMVSSGLPESILENILNKEDIKNDVNSFIDNIYLGNKTEIESDKLTEKINNNINNYLTEHNVTITDQKSLKLFVQDLNKIYNDNVYLYNLIDGFIKTFSKVSKLINILIIVLVISISILLLFNIFVIKNNYIGSLFIGSGLILLFSKMLILDAIEFKNVLIISQEFSNIIKILYEQVEFNIIISILLLIIIGVLISVGVSIRSSKVLKKGK